MDIRTLILGGSIYRKFTDPKGNYVSSCIPISGVVRASSHNLGEHSSEDILEQTTNIYGMVREGNGKVCFLTGFLKTNLYPEGLGIEWRIDADDFKKLNWGGKKSLLNHLYLVFSSLTRRMVSL